MEIGMSQNLTRTKQTIPRKDIKVEDETHKALASVGLFGEDYGDNIVKRLVKFYRDHQNVMPQSKQKMTSQPNSQINISGPVGIRTQDLRFSSPLIQLRFRRPPRYPDYATGPISMLNNETPYINEIVIMSLVCLPIQHIMLQALRQMFCDHKESFVYRKYEEFQFIEFCNCTRCGKTLRHFFGFDEDIRG